MHLRSASGKQKRTATIITLFGIPLSGFMTDIYLPSFPSMAQSLAVSEQSIQLTLTCFFLSYGFAQLFVGSLLDSIGRYKAVLVSLGVLCISSLAIAFTTDIWLICFWRIVQGLATSFIIVAKRAYFVDLYEGEKRKYFLSYFTVIWSCGPIIAPFLGGYMESLFNWQANFYFLAVYSGLLLIAEALYSGETIRQKKSFNLKKMVLLYNVMLRNKAFMTGTMVLGLAYSVVMVFNIAGPFVVQQHFGYSEVIIGYCTLALGIAWMIGGFLSKHYTTVSFASKNRSFTIAHLLLVIVFIGVGALADNLLLLISFAFFILILGGFIFTNYFTHNMIYFPNNAGIAGGLMGGLLYIITSFSSFLISVSGDIETTFDMSLRYLMFILPLTLFVLYTAWLHQKRNSPAT